LKPERFVDRCLSIADELDDFKFGFQQASGHRQEIGVVVSQQHAGARQVFFLEGLFVMPTISEGFSWHPNNRVGHELLAKVTAGRALPARRGFRHRPTHRTKGETIAVLSGQHCVPGLPGRGTWPSCRRRPRPLGCPFSTAQRITLVGRTARADIERLREMAENRGFLSANQPGVYRRAKEVNGRAIKL
jgi:hypothetical protein